MAKCRNVRAKHQVFATNLVHCRELVLKCKWWPRHTQRNTDRDVALQSQDLNRFDPAEVAALRAIYRRRWPRNLKHYSVVPVPEIHAAVSPKKKIK